MATLASVTIASILAPPPQPEVRPWKRAGQELRDLRLARQLTLGDVAVKSDVPLPTIAKVEKGEIRNPRFKLSMGDFFRIAMAVSAIPVVHCPETWNDSTQYAEIYDLNAKIDLESVRPLRGR